MEPQELNELFKKYDAGTLSDREKRLLEAWYNQYATENRGRLDHEELEKRLKSVANKIPVHYQREKIQTVYYRIAIAASILIAISISIWSYYHRAETESQIAQNKILPGGNKAVLTLSDGQKINLSETQAGIILKDDIIYYEDGSTVSDPEEQKEQIAFLELTTPPGGTYQITLADGTKVWLNASTTLKYPSQFSDQAREVYITGEGYFEVMPDANKPFKVSSRGQDVEVIGTAFNVSAYEGEPEVKTTLVEGTVKIVNSESGTTNRLHPGEQSTIVNGNTHIAPVDVSAYTAWKDGLFRYNDQSLEAILRNVSRWYQVEIVYKNDSLKEERFVGMVSRYDDISIVLGILEEVGNASFTIEGHTVIVDKK